MRNSIRRHPTSGESMLHRFEPAYSSLWLFRNCPVFLRSLPSSLSVYSKFPFFEKSLSSLSSLALPFLFPMASTNPYGGGGGIGGKMRRRPTRSQSTPYDRPPTAVRTPAAVPPAIDGSNGWLSKLLDPASRFLSGSASNLFSSLFRKSLQAPPQIPASVSSPGWVLFPCEAWFCGHACLVYIDS
jgi:hypothetical protein